MMPQHVDRTIYIASQGRTVQIVTAPDDGWAYDLHWRSVDRRPDDAEEVTDLVALDAIFDQLRISNPSVGRDFVNALWRGFRIDTIHAGRPIHSTERRRRVDAPK